MADPHDPGEPHPPGRPAVGASARAARLLLRLAALLVPHDRRASWRREWAAELDEARRTGRWPVGLAWGALPDAWAVRRIRKEEETRMKRRSVMAETAGELGRALRSLLRAPTFTGASVLTLAVGLGATAAIITLVDSILLRPLPYPDAERIVRVSHAFEGSGGDNPVARFTFPFFRDENRSFEVMGAYWSPSRSTISGEVEQAERVPSVRATPELLGVLGARPVAGRLFTEEDALEEEVSGVVLSHGLWVRRFGADPSVVGSTVVVDGRTRPVLGVMAPDVDLPRDRIDLWIPYAVPAGIRADDAFRLQVLGRLRPGTDVVAAEADLSRLTARLPEFGAFYRTYLDDFALETRVQPVLDEVVGELARPLWILLGAVLFVLAIAAANVATLFLVRAEGRRQGVSIRSALGAGRAGLAGHFLAESLWVALSAGVLGLVLAQGAVRLFTSLAPPYIPRLDQIGLGWPTVVAVLALSLLTTLALGLYPFARFGRGVADALHARDTGESRRESVVGGGLVVAQVGLALVLLSGSALLLRSFQGLRAVDPGFEHEGVLVAELSLPGTSYPSPGEVRAFEDRLLEATRALPGVESAALGPTPLGQGGCNGLYVEGVVLAEGQFPPCVPVVFVSPEYFQVLGIALTAGRGFGEADVDPSSVVVAIASENVARRLWPDGDALRGAVHPSPRRGPPWFPVVGIAEAVRGDGPDQPATEALYLPMGAMDAEGWLSRTTRILVRTDPGRETDLVAGLRRVVTGLDPAVPLTVRGTLAEEQARTMIRSTFTLFLLGTAAATALVLGLVGLYGVVAYRVGRRRAEIGMRMAMGARAAEVRGLVLRHSLRLVGLGMLLGFVASAFLTRSLASVLYGVRPADPAALATAAGTLLLTAFVAIRIPAQRASRVDPAEALRNEA